MEKTTIRALARFSTLVLVAVAVGLLQGDVELYLLLALCGYLLWHLWNLYRFEAWIKAGATADDPDLPVIWGELVSYIIRLKQRSRTRKRRYKLLIKEFRKSSAALPDGTVVLDANNTILWFNQAAGRMLGLKKASDRGQQIMNLVRRPEFVEFVESDRPEGRLTLAAPHQPGHYYSTGTGSLRFAAAHVAGQGHHPGSAGGVHAPGFRGKCLARTALAADRVVRLPGCHGR